MVSNFDVLPLALTPKCGPVGMYIKYQELLEHLTVVHVWLYMHVAHVLPFALDFEVMALGKITKQKSMLILYTVMSSRAEYLQPHPS
jgi:hypothetical protein